MIHVEKFHSRTDKGVMQEIFAHLLVISLTALIEYQSSRELELEREKVVPSFKAAVRVVQRHLMIIVGRDKPLSPDEVTQ